MILKGGGRSGGLKDLETGQVASRAVPVPGPKADPGTQAATADPGTRTAMADRVYGPPPKIVLGGSPAGEYPVRASGDEGELGGASGDEGKLDETNFRGRSGSADSLGRWRGAGTGGRSGRAELDVSSGEEGELNRISRGIGELDGASGGIGELDGTSGGIGELDGTSGGIGELDGTSGGIGELDGTRGGIGELDGTSGGIGELDGISGGISIVAGGSRLMIPGHPSRGTRISRRLILGGLFCHEAVQEVARRSQKTRNEETLNFFETLYFEHGDDRDRYTHSLTLRH